MHCTQCRRVRLSLFSTGLRTEVDHLHTESNWNQKADEARRDKTNGGQAKSTPPPHLWGELSHLGDAPGVVAHGAVRVDGEAGGEGGQHADRGERDACRM